MTCAPGIRRRRARRSLGEQKNHERRAEAVHPKRRDRGMLHRECRGLGAVRGRPARGWACGHAAGDRQPREGTPTSYGPCRYSENAFRAGVDPPRIVSRVEPDLSRLPPAEYEARSYEQAKVA